MAERKRWIWTATKWARTTGEKRGRRGTKEFMLQLQSQNEQMKLFRNKCCSKCSINNNSSNSLSWCNIWWCPWYNSKPKLCRICWIRTIKQLMAILQGKHKNNCHRNFLNHLLFNNIFQKVATLGILSIVSMIVNSICVYLISEKKNSVIMSQHRPLYM